MAAFPFVTSLKFSKQIHFFTIWLQLFEPILQFNFLKDTSSFYLRLRNGYFYFVADSILKTYSISCLVWSTNNKKKTWIYDITSKFSIKEPVCMNVWNKKKLQWSKFYRKHIKFLGLAPSQGATNEIWTPHNTVNLSKTTKGFLAYYHRNKQKRYNKHMEFPTNGSRKWQLRWYDGRQFLDKLRNIWLFTVIYMHIKY